MMWEDQLTLLLNTNIIDEELLKDISITYEAETGDPSLRGITIEMISVLLGVSGRIGTSPFGLWSRSDSETYLGSTWCSYSRGSSNNTDQLPCQNKSVSRISGYYQTLALSGCGSISRDSKENYCWVSMSDSETGHYANSLSVPRTREHQGYRRRMDLLSFATIRDATQLATHLWNADNTT